MQQWEYCEVDFDNNLTRVFYYDEAGDYIDNPEIFGRLGIVLARLGHDGWEIISTWWRSKIDVTYMLKRPIPNEWIKSDREEARERYRNNFPRDRDNR